MNTFVMTFEDYMLTEGRVVFKRRYTEKHPEMVVSAEAPVRERVLSYIREKGTVTHKELMGFFKGLNEETGGATSRKWVNKNARYFVVKEKNNTKTYSLSAIGKRVHESIMKQKTF
jgi:hypothetical protein